MSPADVRDIAIAHRLAMESPRSPGNRYICSGEDTWMPDLARVRSAEFGPRGFRVPTRRMPYWAMRLAARFDPALRLVLGYVGRRQRLSNQKAFDEWGWTARLTAETLRDTAQSLIDHAVVHPRR